MKLKKWRKKQQKKYQKFIDKRNYDFDYSSIVNLLILKLTTMGVYIAKWGIVVPEDRHKKVREIWAVRKHLINSRNAFNIVSEQSDLLAYLCNTASGGEDFLALYEQEQLKKAFALMGEQIQGWWD